MRCWNFSTSEPSDAAALAEWNHFEHLTVTQVSEVPQVTVVRKKVSYRKLIARRVTVTKIVGQHSW